jgi:two-component system, chemotaxis family, chemotaxis protein CheV
MAKDGILLESGTNEVELLEFMVDGQSFGVNVLKVQAIEQFDPLRVTHIQLADPAVIGTLLFRDGCITLVDLAQHLREPMTEAAIDEPTTVARDMADLVATTSEPGEPGDPASESSENKLVLIMEFNEMKTAFRVDGVNRIHRVSWGDISPLSPFLNQTDSKFTGSIQIDAREVLIVDMEKIVTEILDGDFTQCSSNSDPTHPHFRAREELTIFLAEDSAVIRDRVERELANSNYTRVVTFANGQDCYDRIVQMQEEASSEGKPMGEIISAIVSDIEMPAMDGLALCRNIKEELMIKDVPVIMFSSLINDQIAQKCNDVGAESYISKPQFAKLVDLLDKHCLDTKNPRP